MQKQIFLCVCARVKTTGWNRKKSKSCRFVDWQLSAPTHNKRLGHPLRPNDPTDCDVPGSTAVTPPPPPVSHILDGPQKGREREGKKWVALASSIANLWDVWLLADSLIKPFASCVSWCWSRRSNRNQSQNSITVSVCLFSIIVVDAFCSSSPWFSVWLCSSAPAATPFCPQWNWAQFDCFLPCSNSSSNFGNL